MSLFPAADALSVTKEQKSKDSSEWLRNNSYCPNRASELIKRQTENSPFADSSSDSSDHDRPAPEREKRKKEQKRREKDKKRIELDKTSQEKKDVKAVKGQKFSVIVDQLDDRKKVFCSDPTSDLDNVHFGRLYKVLIPKYYRDLVYCVGTPKWRYVQVKESRKKKRKRKNEDRDHRYFSEKIPTSTRMIVRPRSELISHGENYMEIKNETNSGEIVTDNHSTEVETNLETDFAKKNTERLNRRTREEPQNVDVWLEFLSWQNELMKDNSFHRSTRALNEKKIEILNHAIKANPKVERFQLMRVALQAEILTDTAALDKEWQNLLFRFPDNVDVWQGYISHITCSDYSAFSIKRTRRAFAHCLEILRSIKDGSYKQATVQVAADERLVEVFVEYADFLSATGHTEQWVALYRCILELNFRGPPQNLSRMDMLEYLQMYHKGSDPKLGEERSKGFREWVMKHEAGGWVVPTENKEEQNPENDDDDEDLVDPDLSLAQNWLKMEQFRSENHWLPWFPSFDGDTCDDDDRKIDFADLKNLMFIVKRNDLKMQLVLNFLRLLGSPVCYHTTTRFPFSEQHPFFFTHQHHILKLPSHCLHTKPLLFGRGSEPHNPEFLCATCRGCLSGVLSDRKHKFICEMFAQILQSTKGSELSPMVACEYISYYLNRIICLHRAGKPQRLKKCGKEARKEAKKILSCYPNLLRVWCLLAEIEWLSGKPDEACKIFQTTLAMTSSDINGLDRSSRRKKATEIHCLCRNFVHLHFFTCATCSQKSNDACAPRDSVFATLAALGDKYKFSEYYSALRSGSIHPTHVIKGSAGFINLNEEAASLYEQEEYEAFSQDVKKEALSSYFDVLCCHVVFLLMSGSPTHAEVITNGILFLKRKIEGGSIQAKYDLENLYHMQLYILTADLTKYRRQYRDIVYSAASEFPTNPLFSRYLSDIDLASYLSGGVRRHFTKICGDNPKSDVVWICAANYEIMRRRKILEASSVEAGPNESGRLLDARIRNLFERALEKNAGSVALWRGYMAAEVEVNPGRVYQIYCRAVNACSWSRDLHIDMLMHDQKIINEIVQNISHKGLRLRTPIEEVQLLITM